MLSDTTLLQPVSDIQLSQLKIEWVQRETIKPNKYNPNKMTAQDRALLRQSILEDGWTQPIVTLLDGIIVDGEQRWTVSGMPLKPAEIQEIITKMEERQQAGYPESESILFRLREGKRRLEAWIASGKPGSLAAITGGLVPITRVDFGDDAHKMISTIRHNRARGTHSINAMSGITNDLIQLGLDFDDLERRLGMDDEEISRFMKAAEGQAKALMAEAVNEFSVSSQIQHIQSIDPDSSAAKELQRSSAANQASKDWQNQLADRRREVEQKKLDALAAAQAGQDAPLTQIQKEKIIKQVESSIALPDKPEPPSIKKIIIAITPEEYQLAMEVFTATTAIGVIEACSLIKEDPALLAELHERISSRLQ